MGKKVVRRKKVAKRPPESRSRSRSSGRSRDEEEKSGAGDYIAWGVRAVVVIALAIAALMIVPPWMRAKEAEPIWNEAVETANGGDHQKALELYAKAMKIAHDFEEMKQNYPIEVAKCHQAIAYKAERQGDYKEAVKHYKKVVANDPELTQKESVHLRIAECYNRSERREAEALKYAKLAVEKGDRDAAIARNLVKMLQKK